MNVGTATSLRERKRLDAMRRVQRHALDRFASDGFDDVTVEEIATAAEVSPVSIYRWFGTKERLVLWDEYDPPLLERIADELGRRSALEAVAESVVAELDRIYDADRELVLDRTRLIHAEPALMRAASEDANALVEALAELFAGARRSRPAYGDAVLAAAAVAVLTRAVDEWQRRDARTPLADLVREGFATLRGAG